MNYVYWQSSFRDKVHRAIIAVLSCQDDVKSSKMILWFQILVPMYYDIMLYQIDGHREPDSEILIDRHRGKMAEVWGCGTLHAHIKRNLQGNRRFRNTPSRI